MAHHSEDYQLTFDPDGVACVRLSGDATMPGIIDASVALYSDAAWTPGRPELWDLSGIDSLDVTPESLRAVAEFEGGLAEVVGPGRTAIVVSREDDFDIGLLYEHLPKDNGREHRTFWHEDTARAWLLGGAEPSDRRADLRKTGPAS